MSLALPEVPEDPESLALPEVPESLTLPEDPVVPGFLVLVDPGVEVGVIPSPFAANVVLAV